MLMVFNNSHPPPKLSHLKKMIYIFKIE